MARYYLFVVTLVLFCLVSFVRSQCDGLNNPIAPALDGPLNTTNLVTFDDIPYPFYGFWGSATGPFQVSSKVGQSIILTGDTNGGQGQYAFLRPDAFDSTGTGGNVKWNNDNFWAGSTTEKPGFFYQAYIGHWGQLQFDPPVSAFVMRANTDYYLGNLGVIKISDVNGNLIECRNIPTVAGINAFTTLGFSSAVPIKYVWFKNTQGPIVADNIQYITCDAGYMYNGSACVDIDECTLFNNTCGDHATCMNTIGSHDCICDRGYEMNNGSCVDINECLNGGCGDHSNCTNTEGSYSCVCDDGYELNNQTILCEDINECLSDVCGVHEKCTNIGGSYSCSCADGYELNNKTMACQDINECLTGVCGDHATCTNTDGSYSCTCDNGYERNNDVCIAVSNVPQAGRSPSTNIVSSARINIYSPINYIAIALSFAILAIRW